MTVKDQQRVEEILKEIDSIGLKLSGLKRSLENILRDNEMVEVSVYQVRRAAMLEEVYRLESIATAEQLSEIAVKWGRSPQGVAGYFSGDNPSLRAIAGGKRALTDKGLSVVMDNRSEWGEDWLDRVDLSYVGNSNTPDDTMINI